MIMVIGICALMTLLVVSALALSMGSMKKADNDADWNAALAAAFAGLEEYQSHLSEEPGYVQYGNPASYFSNPSQVSDSLATVHLPTTANPAFGVGPTGTWAIAHDDGAAGTGAALFRFRYEVDNSSFSAKGNIRLRATGLSGGQTRSIVADVRQTGFIDYVYFTDLEMSDPAITNNGCALIHWWEGRTGSGCKIQFASADQLHGPVHSNDTLFICGGATFDSVVTTARPTGGYLPGTTGSNCNSGAPAFGSGAPLFSPAIAMPATNSELIKETRSDIPTEVPRPGCLYTGPTKITFGPTVGKMTVWSPWTKKVNITNAAGTTGTNSPEGIARCGSISALQSSSGATIDVVPNNVVYVQNIPLSGDNGATTAETQTTAGSQTKNGVLMCKQPDGTIIGNGSKSSNSFTYSQNVVGFPAETVGNASVTETPPVPGTTSTASYGCRNGDVFISGTNSGGAITIAAQNYVYVTGELRYANTDTDMTGLVGQNAVWVHNPVNSSGAMLNGSNRRIDAAILSVAHTFTVQNYNLGSGSRGTLTVFGSIAQKYRGPVGTTGPTGYTKNYLYDSRFKYTAPPKFLSPATTTYGINIWVEISPVFEANGCRTDDVVTPACQ